MEELKVKPSNANFTKLYQMIAKIKTPPKITPEETNEETLYENPIGIVWLYQQLPLVLKILVVSFASAAALNVVSSVIKKFATRYKNTQAKKYSNELPKKFLADPEYKKLVDAFNKNPVKENLDRLAKATNEKIGDKNDT